MHTPVVCICKNENQASKRPAIALCSVKKEKETKPVRK